MRRRQDQEAQKAGERFDYHWSQKKGFKVISCRSYRQRRFHYFCTSNEFNLLPLIFLYSFHFLCLIRLQVPTFLHIKILLKSNPILLETLIIPA